ncbi:sugar ABC transporter permease [Actinocorallia longicatena]|uniref:Sugar ABC transporter permease n=1 Tax=Actinocorallia longicatena TaxID=111803 RepID=A0ABP6PW96_9ACTN
MPYAFLTPAIVLFVVFCIVPIGYSVYMSLRKAQVKGLGLRPGDRTEVFAGTRNYANALKDPELIHSVLRVLGYGLIVVPMMLGLALLFALLLDGTRARLVRSARIAIFLPYAIPTVIASLMWGFLYLPSVSPIVDLLGGADLFAPSTVLYSIANVAVWGGTGFNMMVIYTSLRAIPSDLYEAARIDGASELRIAFRIKIPLIVPSLVMTAVFAIISTLQVVSEPMALKPLSNSIISTWSPLMKVYTDAFERGDLYSAAATSVLLAVATLVLSFGFLRLVGDRAFASEGGS